jgi:heat shock protein HslJ
MKTFEWVLLVIVLVAGGLLIISRPPYVINDNVLPGDYKNAVYFIEGQQIALLDGYAESPIENSGAKMITKYFGNELKKDLNDDGREDVVFLVTQERGGSGTFFYVVAALNTEDGYLGSDGYLLGDRIAPQTTEVSQNPRHKNVIVVNYADRNRGEPMTIQPSIGKSAYLKLDIENMQWSIVLPDFEGEADPERMNLQMKDWVWVRAEYNDERVIKPKKEGDFVLSLKEGGKFSVDTDCNNMSGEYKTDSDKKITFSKMISTKMYCEGSVESDFAKLLENSASYYFTSRGEMVLDLKYDSGVVIFR